MADAARELIFGVGGAEGGGDADPAGPVIYGLDGEQLCDGRSQLLNNDRHEMLDWTGAWPGPGQLQPIGRLGPRCASTLLGKPWRKGLMSP